MGERVGQQQKASTQPHLSGWALIKEHMLKFDDGTVKNLNDDINALPTFAGLFSTVVTGFIIEFYKTLPREDSDPQITNVVLKHISQQLGHISQQMANSTFPPIPLTTGSDDFHSSISPTTTVWIISFWFFSLVLSLAAALFGMMAKSWLREYSQWTTMSGPPEETVRLRQGRYEAFESWKTPAIIASLPALLEASFVLFLIGMEILLWTLDDIVFGACTAAVGVLIVLVIVATLLPAFRAQCPYRSPMAWTFLLAKAALLSVWHPAPDSSGNKRSDLEKNDFLAQERSSSRVMVKKNWREQDLYMQRSSLGSTRDWNDDDFAAAGRLYTLIRALLWIMETSQDRRLLTAVDECITDTRMHVFRHPFGRLIQDFTLVCQTLRIDTRQLVPPVDQCFSPLWPRKRLHNIPHEPISPEGRPDKHIYHIPVVTADVSEAEPFRPHLCLYGGRWESRTIRCNGSAFLRVHLARMIARDIWDLLENYQYVKEEMHNYGNQADYYLQSSLVLGLWLAYSAVQIEGQPSVATKDFVKLFTRLCYDYYHFAPRMSALVSPLFLSLRQCEEKSEDRLLLPSEGPFRFTQLALVVPFGEPSAWQVHECALFVCISSDALLEWRTSPEDGQDVDDGEIVNTLCDLLDRMTGCAQRCRLDSSPNCGAQDHEFRWPNRLAELAGGRILNSSIVAGSIYNLVYALKDSADAGLIAETASAVVIQNLAIRLSVSNYDDKTLNDSPALPRLRESNTTESAETLPTSVNVIL